MDALQLNEAEILIFFKSKKNMLRESFEFFNGPGSYLFRDGAIYKADARSFYISHGLEGSEVDEMLALIEHDNEKVSSHQLPQDSFLSFLEHMISL